MPRLRKRSHKGSRGHRNTDTEDGSKEVGVVAARPIEEDLVDARDGNRRAIGEQLHRYNHIGLVRFTFG